MSSDVRNMFKKNLIFAFLAQGIGFAFSILMSLLVPKLLGVEQFSYWQLFVFYSGYVGFFHFGLSDGVYLRYGGFSKDKLDKNEIVSQFRFMLLWQFVICAIVCLVVSFLNISFERKVVIYFVAIYLIIANATWFWGYVFQAINQTKVYSASIIIAKSLFILFVLLVFFIKSDSFVPFILFYIITQSVALGYVLYKSRDFLLLKQLPIKDTLKVTWTNIVVGINLTISNIASSLILGVGRAMIDKSAGITSFGMLSLAVSITNFFLQFIAAVSMVMFPALRQVDMKTAKQLFEKLRSWISFLLCFILLMYIPLKIILSWWLPQYTDSLKYMAFLLPICIFDGKMQLLFNTYLKVLRKEKTLLLINVISLIISVAFCAIGAFCIKNIFAVSLAMTIAIVIRSGLANMYLTTELGIKMDSNIVWECALSLIFVVLNVFVSDLGVFCLYLFLYAVYLLVNQSEVNSMLNAINKRRGKKDSEVTD